MQSRVGLKQTCSVLFFFLLLTPRRVIVNVRSLVQLNEWLSRLAIWMFSLLGLSISMEGFVYVCDARFQDRKSVV